MVPSLPRPATLVALSCLAFAAMAHAGKPGSWSASVREAAPQPPVFWLDSTPDRNEGTVGTDPTTYAEGEWKRRVAGYWGDDGGAFGLPVDAESGVRIRDTKLTDVAASASGALAVLFRAPSAFDDGQPHSIINRGDYAAPAPFELSIHGNQLRLSALVNDRQKALDMAPVEPDAWCWVALDWEPSGQGATEIRWRIWSHGGLQQSGSLQADRLGTAENLLQLGGRVKHSTLADGVFSQVIVWDVPVGEEGWSKLESLLATP